MSEITATTGLTRQTAAAATGQTHMVTVAKTTGVGPVAQMMQLMRLKKAPTFLTSHEYYDFQLYRPSLSKAAKAEFLGEKGSFALNLKLSPPGLTHLRGFLSDKAALTALFGAWGLPTTTTRAVFAPDRRLGNVTTLRDAGQVADWLLAQDQFPIFGKPAKGCQARGTVRINGIDRQTGMATLATGQAVLVSTLAAEMAQNAEYGYIFQDVVAQHSAITALIGSQNVSTLRLVTVVRDRQPELLYAVWKLGSAQAMSDNFWQKGSLIAHVDAQTGRVLTCRHGSGTATDWVNDHPVTGQPIVGQIVPNFAKAVALALEAHGAFPVNGVLGWDIALTDSGACLIECNENTGHALYQYAADRGVMNADFQLVFTAIMARNAGMEQANAAKHKAYTAAKARF